MRQPSNKPSVLFIEDNAMLRRSIALTLRKGANIKTAESAEEALLMFERGERFAAILCDMSLPGMSGRDFHARLQSRSKDQASRVIILSGHDPPSEEEDCDDPLARRWLCKPTSRHTILSMIERVIRDASRAVTEVFMPPVMVI